MPYLLSVYVNIIRNYLFSQQRTFSSACMQSCTNPNNLIIQFFRQNREIFNKSEFRFFSRLIHLGNSIFALRNVLTTLFKALFTIGKSQIFTVLAPMEGPSPLLDPPQKFKQKTLPKTEIVIIQDSLLYIQDTLLSAYLFLAQFKNREKLKTLQGLCSN